MRSRTITNVIAMTAPTLSIRSSIQSPRRVLAVWLFCIAAVAFWIGVLQLVTGLPIAIAALVIGFLSLATLPCAARMVPIIWDDAEPAEASPST